MSLDHRVSRQPRVLLWFLGITSAVSVLAPFVVLVAVRIRPELVMAGFAPNWLLFATTHGVQGLLALVSMVLLLVWLHRVVSSLGREKVGYSPTFAVVAWLIPLANLVLPPLILRSVWRAALNRSDDALLIVWWLFWAEMLVFLGFWLVGPELVVQHIVETMPRTEHGGAGTGILLALLTLGAVFWTLYTLLLGSSLSMGTCFSLLLAIVHAISKALPSSATGGRAARTTKSTALIVGTAVGLLLVGVGAGLVALRSVRDAKARREQLIPHPWDPSREAVLTFVARSRSELGDCEHVAETLESRPVSPDVLLEVVELCPVPSLIRDAALATYEHGESDRALELLKRTPFDALESAGNDDLLLDLRIRIAAGDYLTGSDLSEAQRFDRA